MDDGYWPWRIIGLIALWILDILIHGFEKSVQRENRTFLKSRAEEGDAEAAKCLNTVKKQRAFTGIRRFLMIAGGLYLGVCIWPVYSEAGGKWPFMVLAAAVFYLLSNLVLLISGYRGGLAGEEVTEEEILSMVSEGNEQGVLEDSEAEMIHNIINFGDKNSGDIMTRRTSVIAFEGHMKLKDAAEQMMLLSKSRFPVYDEEIDNIVGILYFRDAIAYGRTEENQEKPIMEIDGLIREAELIPETKKIDMLFHDMRIRKIHMMLVVDEYGQLAGLVTLEDVLEEIVGNIFDEYDEVEKPHFEQVSEDAYIIEGMTPLEELEKILDIEFETEDVDTINGFLLYKLGHFPEQEEDMSMRIGEYRFTVLETDSKIIQKIKVEKAA